MPRCPRRKLLLSQIFSNLSLWANSISIAWKCTQNADSWLHLAPSESESLVVSHCPCEYFVHKNWEALSFKISSQIPGLGSPSHHWEESHSRKQADWEVVTPSLVELLWYLLCVTTVNLVYNDQFRVTSRWLLQLLGGHKRIEIELDPWPPME